MEARTVIVDPELRTDKTGEYRYVSIALWKDQASKVRNRQKENSVKVRAKGSSVDLYADLVNDFRVYYSASGERVKNFGRDGRPVWRHAVTGLLIEVGDLVSLGEVLPKGPWVKERYQRDIEAEINESFERYQGRATRKSQIYWGDKRGSTLNLQADHSNYDGYSHSSFWNATETVVKVGTVGFDDTDCYLHFTTGVSGLSGVTIDSASLQVKGTKYSSPKTNVYCDDVESPVAPAAHTSSFRSYHANRPRTTAFVAADNVSINTSTFAELADITSVIQELADDYDPTAITALIDNDGSSVNNMYQIRSYDFSSGDAAKLDIDYTAGGVTITPSVLSLSSSVQGTPPTKTRKIQVSL